MKINKEKGELGIFISDASFRKKERISLIGIKCNTTGKTWTRSIGANSPMHAEEQGIKEALRIAQNETSFYNVLFICDNKEAIKNIQKEYNKKNPKPFRTAQFLWLPRKYLDDADFLTKNVDTKLEKNIENKKTKNFNKNLLSKTKKHINSIKPKKDMLEKRYKQFQAIKGDHYRSKFFTLKNININLLQDLYLEEIDVICQDIENTNDQLEKSLANIIAESILL